jgi:hypothetical protein
MRTNPLEFIPHLEHELTLFDGDTLRLEEMNFITYEGASAWQETIDVLEN